jgi:hypothetical protein
VSSANTRSADYQPDAFVLYYASAATYGIRASPRRRTLPPGESIRDLAPHVRSTPRDGGFAEYQELATLRRAQAWGTPLFHADHPDHAAALARLRELEQRERAVLAVIGGHPVRSSA